MKIGICLASAPGYSETFLRSKIKGLGERGFKLNVFLFNRSKFSDDINSVNPFPVQAAWLWMPFVLLTLLSFRLRISKRFVQLELADGKSLLSILKSLYLNAHIFIKGRHDWLHFSFATIAIGRENVAKAIGAKLAISIRGFDIGLYPITHPGCYENLWRKVSKLHTISDDLYDLAILDGLSRSVPFKKIRPAIQTANILAKNTFGFVQQPVRILSVGRLEWKKGFVYAIQAISYLRASGINVNYQIAGTGSVEQELRYMIRDLKLENTIKLLGRIEHKHIFQLMHDSDIYIQPSVQEGFCNSLLEAQGTGLLCISTDAEGLAENILHEKTGWIVPKRNPKALSDKVIDVLAMSSKDREKICLNAMKRVKEEFQIDRLINEFISFYNFEK